MPATLGEIAVRFGCELRGDPDTIIDGVAALSGAHERTISFLANNKYARELKTTRAAAVVIDAVGAEQCPVAALVARNPHATFARIAAWLHPEPVARPGVHVSAVVDRSARVDPTAHIAAGAVIGERAKIGARAFIGPGCTLGDDVEIADDVRLAARVTLCRGTVIGARAIVHPGAVIGADGFGYANDRGTWVKVPQIGRVLIGADVEIGANTTIDRGAIGDTVIEDGVKLDNQIQIGHNVRIGAHTAMAACVGISGSVTIGKRCMLGGAVGVVGHLTIGDDVVVTGYSMIATSITEPGVYSSGIPAEPVRDWRRIVGRLKRIESLVERVRLLEKRELQGEEGA